MIVYLQYWTYFQFIPFWHRKSILILRPELHPLAPSAARSVPVAASLRRHFWHAGREGYKTRSWWGNLRKPCSYKNWNGTNLLRIPNTFWEQALGRWRRWIPRKLLLEQGSIEWLPARRASSLASQEPLAKMTWSQVVALYQWHVASPTTADHCMKMKKKHGKTSLAFAACLSRTLMRTHIRFKSDSRFKRFHRWGNELHLSVSPVHYCNYCMILELCAMMEWWVMYIIACETWSCAVHTLFIDVFRNDPESWAGGEVSVFLCIIQSSESSESSNASHPE